MASVASYIGVVVIPEERLISDTVPQPRLKRSNPGQEILQLPSRTLPFSAYGLEAGQHLISPG